MLRRPQQAKGWLHGRSGTPAGSAWRARNLPPPPIELAQFDLCLLTVGTSEPDALAAPSYTSLTRFELSKHQLATASLLLCICTASCLSSIPLLESLFDQETQIGTLSPPIQSAQHFCLFIPHHHPIASWNPCFTYKYTFPSFPHLLLGYQPSSSLLAASAYTRSIAITHSSSVSRHLRICILLMTRRRRRAHTAP